TNAIPRLLEGLRVPRKGLIGPWAHTYPHLATPGPSIGFLQEVRRWFDRWLLGIDTAIMDEPLFRVFMQQPPGAGPGRWVSEPEWPSSRIQPVDYFLSPEKLHGEPRDSDSLVAIESPMSTGTAGGSWCPFGSPEEMPTDQKEDDARSALFDSPPLNERIEILGAPELRLKLACDRPTGVLAARLIDVFPDGASSRVSYALLNLTHRESDETPSPLIPGEVNDVTLRLNDVAYAFLPGHRLRVALSTAYWPIAWPAPQSFRLKLHIGESRLTIPRRPPRGEDAHLAPFDEPESAPGLDTTELDPGSTSKILSREPSTGEVHYRVETDFTDEGRPALTRIEETRMEHGHAAMEEFSIRDSDPLSARTDIRHDVLFQRDDWSARVETSTRIACDAKDFHVEAELEGFEGDRRVFRRAWSVSVRRNAR
ncbi:MAG: CocE/NonD family hydrolase, partial [Vicinamibacteria bacterium]